MTRPNPLTLRDGFASPLFWLGVMMGFVYGVIAGALLVVETL